MKVYEANRTKWGRSVRVIDNNDFTWLDPRPSQKLINHSPDGFEWGYHGSGPAQLALAMLYDVVGFENKEIALCHYQKFKESFISGCAKEGFLIPEKLIVFWLQDILKTDVKL